MFGTCAVSVRIIVFALYPFVRSLAALRISGWSRAPAITSVGTPISTSLKTADGFSGLRVLALAFAQVPFSTVSWFILTAHFQTWSRPALAGGRRHQPRGVFAVYLHSRLPCSIVCNSPEPEMTLPLHFKAAGSPADDNQRFYHFQMFEREIYSHFCAHRAA